MYKGYKYNIKYSSNQFIFNKITQSLPQTFEIGFLEK